MSFDPQREYRLAVRHFVRMNHYPGARDHMWLRINEVDCDDSGLFRGIKADLIANHGFVEPVPDRSVAKRSNRM